MTGGGDCRRLFWKLVIVGIGTCVGNILQIILSFLSPYQAGHSGRYYSVLSMSSLGSRESRVFCRDVAVCCRPGSEGVAVSYLKSHSGKWRGNTHVPSKTALVTSLL